jgi:hypothetical protein
MLVTITTGFYPDETCYLSLYFIRMKLAICLYNLPAKSSNLLIYYSIKFKCQVIKSSDISKDENGRKQSKTDLRNRKRKRLVRYISTF